MKTQNMADVISSRRKELGMTQRELADRLNITDKAVSKWERGLACPDTAIIPKLAEILGVSLEELMLAKPMEQTGHRGSSYLVELILKAVPLAMGIAVAVLSILGELDPSSGFAMLGIGLACAGIRQLQNP